MRIKSVYISAFGGLKDYTLDFTDGMQVILGENEAGKTTVTEFIKAMFYGTGKRAAGQAMSIREKYTPFDGSQAGGRIFFERGGREYCIERQFRRSDATDRVTLTDTAAGKTEPCAPDIGRELFGISVGAFERSVFIGNTPDIVFDGNAQGEINQKLSNAALSGGDDVSCRAVLNRIDDARLKLISKSGRTGSQIADINELNALTDSLAESDRLARKKQEILAAISDTEKKLGSLAKRHKAVLEVLARARDIENARKLKEYLDTKEELDRLTAKLTLSDGTVADEMFLKKFEFGFSKLDNIENRIETAKAELVSLRTASGLSDSSPELIREKIELAKKQAEECDKQILMARESGDSLEAKISALKEDLIAAENAKKPFNPLLIAFGVAFIAAAAVLWFTPANSLFAAIAAAAGAILAVLGFVIRPANPQAAQSIQREIDSLGGELSALSGRIMMLKSEKSNIEAKTESYNIALNFGISGEQKIKEKENYIESETAALNLERQKLLKFFGFAEDADIAGIKAHIEKLYSLADEQKNIKIKLSYLSRDLGGISYDEAREKLANTENADAAEDLEAKKQEDKALTEEESKLKNFITRLETELKTGFRGMRDPEDLRREIAGIKEKIAAKQEFYDAATLAYNVLQESFITARQSFGGILEDETLKNFKAITAGAYGAVTVSGDFDITAEKSGVFGRHELEYLSRGTKDQVYLSLRLAVARLITEKEPLPVIIDDALSQYDDKRFCAALEFLKQYSEETQVCLFTCHKYVADEAKRQDIKTVEL